MASSKCLSSLPVELVEEILYKTPVKSLLRFKSTCKRWCALLNDKKFIHKHLDLSHQQFIALTRGSTQIIFNPVNKALLDVHGYAPSNFDYAIHCDGLLLCLCVGSSAFLTVWNPLFRQLKWITPPNSYTILMDGFGFGYDNNVSRDNYKILMTYRSIETHAGTLPSKVQIYEFKSKLWRSVGNINHDYRIRWHGISMNGNMFWISQRLKDFETIIESFDFSKERFKPICCVPFKSDCIYKGDRVVLSGFEADRLSLLHQHEHVVKIDVWVTNTVTDEVVSLSKYFSVTLPIFGSFNYAFPRFFIPMSNSIMLWCEEEDAMKENIYIKFYETVQDEIKHQVEIGQRKMGTYSYITTYVPSLVPVP